MSDLKIPAWMYAKAGMFLVIGGVTFCLLLAPQPLWARVALQLLMIWAFARAYYFAFYVIERYIDPSFRFAGLMDTARYLAGRRRKT